MEPRSALGQPQWHARPRLRGAVATARRTGISRPPHSRLGPPSGPIALIRLVARLPSTAGRLKPPRTRQSLARAPAVRSAELQRGRRGGSSNTRLGRLLRVPPAVISNRGAPHTAHRNVPGRLSSSGPTRVISSAAARVVAHEDGSPADANDQSIGDRATGTPAVLTSLPAPRSCTVVSNSRPDRPTDSATPSLPCSVRTPSR